MKVLFIIKGEYNGDLKPIGRVKSWTWRKQASDLPAVSQPELSFQPTPSTQRYFINYNHHLGLFTDQVDPESFFHGIFNGKKFDPRVVDIC
jgi:hypothetical protein